MPPADTTRWHGTRIGEAVARAERPGRARGARPARERRELAVGDDLARAGPPAVRARSRRESRRRRRARRREVVRGAREERPQPVGERVVRRRRRARRGRGSSDESTRSPSSHSSPHPHSGTSYRTSLGLTTMLYRRRVLTRARVAALGYVYVVLGAVALVLDGDHRRAATAVFTLAAFAYLWFLGSLRALLVRFDPDGFFASVVVLGGASFLALQAAALATARRRPRRAGRRLRGGGRDRVVARGAPRAEGDALVRPPRRRRRRRRPGRRLRRGGGRLDALAVDRVGIVDRIHDLGRRDDDVPPAPRRCSAPRPAGRRFYPPRMSTHAIFRPPSPYNEPVRDYAPGSPERAQLRLRLEQMRNERVDVPLVIGGRDVAHREHAPRRHAARQGARPRRRAPGRRRGGAGGGRRRGGGVEGLVAPAVGGARDGLPPRGRAALGPVARHAQRGDDARPVEDRRTRPRSTPRAS